MQILDKLNIKYDEVEHQEVFTMEDMEILKGKIEGEFVKSLFLTNHKKGYFIYVLPEEKMADIKKLRTFLGAKELSFGSEERLWEVVKLKHGYVTPLGIINDEKNMVTIILDKELKNKKLLVHPCINTKTISIHYNDLIKFINYLDHDYILY